MSMSPAHVGLFLGAALAGLTRRRTFRVEEGLIKPEVGPKDAVQFLGSTSGSRRRRYTFALSEESFVGLELEYRQRLPFEHDALIDELTLNKTAALRGLKCIHARLSELLSPMRKERAVG